MKSKSFSKSPTIVCCLFTVFLFLLNSCKKDLTISGARETLSISQAKAFFTNEVLPNSPLSLEAMRINRPGLSKTNVLLYKEPLWDKAYEEKVDDGIALAVPIKFLYTNYLLLGPNKKINFEELNYLLIRKDNAGKLHANWMTKLPDWAYVNDNKLRFVGHIVVQDWDGNFEKDFLYEKNGKITEYQKPEKVKQNKNQMLSKTGANWVSITKIESLNTMMSEIDGDTNVLDTTGITSPVDTLVTSLPIYAILNVKYQDRYGDCWINMAEISYSGPDGVGVTVFRRQVDCGGSSGSGGGGGSTETSAWDNNINSLWPGDISCTSFNFGKITDNRMATRLTDIDPITFREVGGLKKSFKIRNLIIDIPIELSNGTSYSAKELAKASAEAMNITAKTLGMIYGQTGKYKIAMDATYERDFVSTFDSYLRANIPGSRVSIDVGDRFDVKNTSKAKYDGFFDGFFGSDCD